MDDVVIVSGARTAVGSFGKSLKDVRARELGARVIAEALRRANLPPDQVEEVVMGCVGQIGDDAYIARTAAIGAGLPVHVTAMTVNRLCASGLQAIVTAAHSLQVGDISVAVAGGTESMSNIPFYLRGARWGYRLGHGETEDGLITLLSDPFQKYHMGVTAENVASKWQVSRADQDAFALSSQQKAGEALATGRMADEIVPITIQDRSSTAVFAVDEHPRPNTTLEKLARLAPAFQKGGTVTAGNSSGINDGAAAVVMTTTTRARELGLSPRLVLRSTAAAAVDPAYMGVGPIPAVTRALQRAGLAMHQMDVIELNEAFAAQAVAVIRDLEMPPERVNVNGGATALGHPVGATGCLLTVKAMYELERRQGRYALVTMCIGGGQGLAAIFERV